MTNAFAETTRRANSGEPQSQPPSLFVELDHVLVSTNITLESFVRFARTGLVPLLHLLGWLMRGRAFAKLMVARSVRVDPITLPYRQSVVDLIHQARSQGREIILISGAHQRDVERVARHLGLFDRVAGSLHRGDLSYESRLERIKREGREQWDYVGGHRTDRRVFAAASHAISVAAAPRGVKVHRIDGAARSPLRALLRALRPHQWAKNLLVLVPLGTSGLWRSATPLAEALLAAIIFSATASGVYLINDLLDIEADRSHPKKRFRPLASGELSIPLALYTASFLISSAIALSYTALGTRFSVVLSVYIFLTTAYSLRIKSVMALDVLALASLYTVRIFAGAVAIKVPVSSWLLIFSIFIFLSLAYLKRYTELAFSTDKRLRIKGRGYFGDDVDVVMMTGISTGMVSVLVLAMFISGARATYAAGTPSLLWILCLVLIYWLNRVWLMARRGEVSGDPIAFAMTDRKSLLLGLVAVLVVIAAQQLHFHLHLLS